MNLNEAFPSAYWRAADIRGTEKTLTISDVKKEVMQNGWQCVVSFKG